MELQHIALAISGANFVLTWGVALYMYLANKNKVTNERINSLQADFDGKLDNHADRIARLEVKADAAPTHDDLSGIHEKINKIGEGMYSLGGKFDGVNTLLQTIHRHLLERS